MATKKKVSKKKTASKRVKKKVSKEIKGTKVPVNTKRANAITNWIKKNKKLATEKIYVQNQIPIEKHGKEEFQVVYRLPRKLLRLNPDNHRFATDWDNLKADRIAAGKKAEPNLEDEDDVQEIRDVLTGQNPVNNDRITTFDGLKTALERAANAGNLNDHNGQTMAGIVTWDGRYINANRRDTAFHEIQKELVKEGKKKSGIDVGKFDYIFVARCPEDIWDEDILSMEMAAQISKDTRDPYDYMNAALLCRRKFNSIYKPKIAGVTSATEKKKAYDEAISATASKVDLGKKGAGPKKIQEYLTFLEFVDGVLLTMRIPKQYNVVNRSSGNKNPISTLLQEAAKQWTKKSTAQERSGIMKAIAMECSAHQANSTKDQFTVRENYRPFLTSINHPQTKSLMKDTIKKFNFKDTEKSSKLHLPVMKKMISRVNAEKEAARPVDLLDTVLENVQAIHRAITTSTGAKDKLRKLSAKQEEMANVIDVAKNIETRLKAFSKLKPVNKNQKPKAKAKKVKRKSRKKPKKRVSAGKKSRR